MKTSHNSFFNISVIILRIMSVTAVTCCVMFIFYNSSRSADVSGNISGAVTSAVNQTLKSSSVDFAFSDAVIRKFAHVVEFAALGFFFTVCLRAFTRRLMAFSAWPLLFSLFIAVCDEFLQYFVPGRSAQVSDIIIDFTGVCAGTAAAMLVICIVGFIMWLVYGRKHKKYPLAEKSI